MTQAIDPSLRPAAATPAVGPTASTPSNEPVAFSTKQLAPYQTSQTRRAIGQLVNSVLPFLALCVAMSFLVKISFWLSFLLAPIAAGFLVRVFIIFHDCGHGSFFRSRRANEVVGFWTGLLTLTPHHQWWREHSLHHASSGNLDKRGVGDIWTMTVQDWEMASRWTKLCYWFVRHPAFMLTVGPFIMFAVLNRFPSRNARRKERNGVILTNLALAALVSAVILAIGWKAYLMIHLPIVLFSGAAGIWLFYVQHQFEGVYWARNGEWDVFRAAVEGSSFYRLPRLLQWFSGNIGFHHIHHLAPRIPNYLLEKCHHEIPAFRAIEGIGVRASMACARFRLWDEERKQLIGFDALRRRASSRASSAMRSAVHTAEQAQARARGRSTQAVGN